MGAERRNSAPFNINQMKTVEEIKLGIQARISLYSIQIGRGTKAQDLDHNIRINELTALLEAINENE
ncbi:hypothetical protein DRO66_08095 [Candidatus Bathyarchaeota archaeon]|nr:MAG: hypothetical protein DRO66_08095 [Candidatus Bathyarchaeota archaeon]